MPDYIDSPQDYRAEQLRGRGRRRLGVLAGLVLVVFLFGRTTLSAWVDLLWYRSLGFGEVFWQTVRLEAGAFVAAALVTFALLFGTFTLLRRVHGSDLPNEHALVIGGRQYSIPVAPAMRVISLVASGGVALIAGLTMLSEWSTLALYWYAPHPANELTDPIFGKTTSFYLFGLPAWQLIDSWLLLLALACCAVSVLFLVVTSGARSLEQRRISLTASPFRGLSATSALLLLVLAMTVYVSRYSMLLEHHTLFDGVTYTDAHVTIPGLTLVALALVVGALLAAANAVRGGKGRGIVMAAAPAVVCYVVLGVVGWYVGTFLVKPNQLVREEPFIANNIEWTRRAFGLDHFQQSEFPAETTVEAADAEHNQQTLNNIRLWELACAAGYAAPGAGDSHVLRLSGCGHRPL